MSDVVAGGAVAYIVVIGLVVVVAAIYFVVRGRQGPPPPHAAEVARERETPHDYENSVPRTADGEAFADGTPVEPGDADTTETGRPSS
jgi:hypothetical protein